MQKLGLVASNNATFLLTLDFSQIAALYPALPGWTIRMQVKNYPTDTTALYEWVTGGVTQGSVVFAPSTGMARFSAPQSGVAALSGAKYFDIRVEVPAVGEFPVAFGEIDFDVGVTLGASGVDGSAGAGLGDTVFCVLSQTLASPAVPPVSLANVNAALSAMAAYAASCTASAASASASLAAVGPAQTAALAALTTAQAAAVAAVVASAPFAAFTQANFITWLNSLPTSLPASPNQWWLDSGSGGVVLARS